MNQALTPTRTLNQRQAQFVEAYVELGDPHRAALQVGYATTTAVAASSQILNLPHVALAIARAVRQRLVAAAPMALKLLIATVQDENCPRRVRVEAARHLLDRAGHVPAKARPVDSGSATPLHELSTDQLRALATKLEDEIAGRARDVTETPVEDASVDVLG